MTGFGVAVRKSAVLRGDGRRRKLVLEGLGYFFLRVLSGHRLGTRSLGTELDAPGAGSLPSPRAVRSC